jgi:3-deoxy-D-manno-octulosonic acid kinase
MLSDPADLGNLPEDIAESLFDPEFWRRRGELTSVSGGRGSAWFIAPRANPWAAPGEQPSAAAGAQEWVLRHFRRGGFIARLSRDLYVWAGEDKVRAFAEWRLLALLWQRGLPVPKPVAARYRRAVLGYRCDLITERIVGAVPLSAMLAQDALAEVQWRAVGAAVARLHVAGVYHADLNAHNILIGGKVGSGASGVGSVSVIDFDRGRLRERGAWTKRNLRRLRRSLDKISLGLPAGRYTAADWDWLMAGYGAALGEQAP